MCLKSSGLQGPFDTLKGARQRIRVQWITAGLSSRGVISKGSVIVAANR